MIKDIYEKPSTNIILSGERLKWFSTQEQEKDKDARSLPLLLFDIVLEMLARAIRIKKQNSLELQWKK